MSANLPRSTETLQQRLVELFHEEHAVQRAVLALILDDDAVRDVLERRLGWGRYFDPSVYRTLAMLDWPDGPPAVEEAMAVWQRLPVELDRVLDAGRAWPHRAHLDDQLEALLWRLVLQADRGPDRRGRWLAAARELASTGGADAYYVAVAIDRNSAVMHMRQVYGTMTASPVSATMLLPLQDPNALDDRRRALGLPPLDQDIREGINYTTVAARLAQLTEQLPDRR